MKVGDSVVIQTQSSSSHWPSSPVVPQIKLAQSEFVLHVSPSWQAGQSSPPQSMSDSSESVIPFLQCLWAEISPW